MCFLCADLPFSLSRFARTTHTLYGMFIYISNKFDDMTQKEHTHTERERKGTNYQVKYNTFWLENIGTKRGREGRTLARERFSL